MNVGYKNNMITNFKTYIAESSLSRIMTHVNKTENFGVISPFRKGFNKENLDNYKELKGIVREKGYGFIELKGGYQEEDGFVDEKSLFIPNIKKKEMIELGKKYNQHSVIVKDKNTFEMIGTNKAAGIGKVLENFKITGKNINVDDVGETFKDFFSHLVKGSHRGKKFLFKIIKTTQEKTETTKYLSFSHTNSTGDFTGRQ